jgi:hypothetical protein
MIKTDSVSDDKADQQVFGRLLVVVICAGPIALFFLIFKKTATTVCRALYGKGAKKEEEDEDEDEVEEGGEQEKELPHISEIGATLMAASASFTIMRVPSFTLGLKNSFKEDKEKKGDDEAGDTPLSAASPDGRDLSTVEDQTTESGDEEECNTSKTLLGDSSGPPSSSSSSFNGISTDRTRGHPHKEETKGDHKERLLNTKNKPLKPPSSQPRRESSLLPRLGNVQLIGPNNTSDVESGLQVEDETAAKGTSPATKTPKKAADRSYVAEKRKGLTVEYL